MLRVSPDGSVVWVQTAGTNMNVVLDADSMEQLNAAPVGRDPEQSAFQPSGRYGLIAHIASDDLVVLDQPGGDPVTAIPLGYSQGNVSFTPDGAYAYVSSFGGNRVFMIEMSSLSVAGSIPVGAQPQGLVLLSAADLDSARQARSGGQARPAGRA